MPEENTDQQKPVGPFDSFEECVREFEDDPDVDDPQALCGWMEENAGKAAVEEYQPDEDDVQALVEEMKEPASSSVLTNLEVTYVSGVEDPAQDSQWVMAKDSAEQGADWGVSTPLLMAQGDAPTIWTGDAAAAYARKLHEALAAKQDTVEEMDFGDYPEAAQENARMALEAREDTDNPNDCGTQVGWERANQLDNGEELTPETVGRMANFRRHQDNAEMEDDEGRADCGWMMWKAWGGEAGVSWAEDKVDTLEEVRQSVEMAAPQIAQEPAEDLSDACWEGYVAVGLKPDPNGDGMVPDCVPEDEVEAQASSAKGCTSCGTASTLALQAQAEGEGEEQQKAWAPVLIPNETDKQGDVIPAHAIEEAAHDFLAQFRNIDTDHDLLEGKGTPIESWTLKEADTFTLPDGSESREYPAGTWLMGVEFEDSAWDRIKSGELTGFSIYGEATEHNVRELLGDDTDLELDAGAVPMQATAKGENTETMSENTQNAEKQIPAEAAAMMEDSINSMLAEQDADAPDVGLVEFLQWGLDNGEFEVDSMEVGGQVLEAGDSGTPEDEQDENEPPEETEMSENPENQEDSGETAEESSEMKEMLEEVRDTVTSTQKSVEQHGERLTALEAEVFEKEGEQPEGEEQPEASEAEVEAAASEAAEEEVKSLLGIEELPEDPEERQEVVRKHLHDEGDGDGGLGAPGEWGTDEVQEVVK